MTQRAVRFSSPTSLPKPMGYSHLAEVTDGKLVYIAGQVPMDASGAIVGADDFSAQLVQVFSNLKIAVEAAGGTFGDIVKLNYSCVERVAERHFPQLDAARERHDAKQAAVR